jgi:circadian clock protein KaiB
LIKPKAAKSKPVPSRAIKPKAVKRLTPNAHELEKWQLRLYVTDQTFKSVQAFVNLKRFCESHLKGRYNIKVIDLLKHPKLARGDQILAVPTVVRLLPKPVRTLIGTLSDAERMLVGLDLRSADESR